MTRTLGAIVLAAGESKRFGPKNKLLADVGGDPLIRRVVREVSHSKIDDIVIVTGCNEYQITSALAGLSVRYAYNRNWRSGMGTSIAAGIAVLRAGVDAAFVVPGDMPRISTSLLNQLAEVFETSLRQEIVFPETALGQQRNPVLWPRRFFLELMELSGEVGAKKLLQARSAECRAVSIVDPWALKDIDTLADLEAMRARE